MRLKLLGKSPLMAALAMAGVMGMPLVSAQDFGGGNEQPGGGAAQNPGGALGGNPGNSAPTGASSKTRAGGAAVQVGSGSGTANGVSKSDANAGVTSSVPVGTGGGKGPASKPVVMSHLDVPHAFGLTENMLNNWIRNSADIPYPNQVPNFRAYPATVAITSLLELDDKTADKIELINTEALTKGREIAVKYGKKLDAAFRARLQEGRGLLDKGDQPLLDLMLKAWDGNDEARRENAETDPKRRADRAEEQTKKALTEALKTFDAAQKDRLLTYFATHVQNMFYGQETDAHLALYFGQTRIEWADLFAAKDGDAAKYAEFDKHYLAIRDGINADLTKDLNALYNDAREKMLAIMPKGKDREDLQKIVDWNKSNGPKLNDAHQQQYDAMKGMTYDPAMSQADRMKKSQESMQQYTAANQAAADLNKDLGTVYADRFKEKVPAPKGWGREGGSEEGEGGGVRVNVGGGTEGGFNQ